MRIEHITRCNAYPSARACLPVSEYAPNLCGMDDRHEQLKKAN